MKYTPQLPVKVHKCLRQLLATYYTKNTPQKLLLHKNYTRQPGVSFVELTPVSLVQFLRKRASCGVVRSNFNALSV